MTFYSLTHLTGRKKDVDRKTIILTVEAARSTWIILVASLAASVIPTALAYSLFGQVTLIIVPPLVIGAAFFLFKFRSSRGLQLPMYKVLMDRRAGKDLARKVLVCGVEMPDTVTLGQMVPSSVTVHTERTGPADLFAETAREPATNRKRNRPAYGRTPKKQPVSAGRSDILA